MTEPDSARGDGREGGEAAGPPIVLIGFMATGKSTVAEILAGELDLPALDLDRAVEARAGASIATLFAERGEAAFRALEAEELERALAGPPRVIATGGGAPCHGENLERMRAGAFVAALSAPLESVLARVPDPSGRPLLAQPREELEALYREREPIYRQAHAAIETSELSPAEIAERVARAWRRAASLTGAMRKEAVILSLERATYPVAIGRGALAEIGPAACQNLGYTPTRAGIVADEHVAPLYAARVERSFAEAGVETALVTVPAGERAKSAAELERLAEELVAGGVDRRGVVVALGGGVTGDLGGLAAAVLHRGVPVVQAPTTLVAMIDAAIGGKTGINLRAGKNLVGAFWQPALVAVDPATLATLPARELRAAYGELLKYALLDGEELYRRAEAIAPAVADGNAPEAIDAIIRRCVAIKAWIVGRDEREVTGERALLNLGHTVGHAIEAATEYGEFLHGEAVALGLVAACRVSAALGCCEPALEARVARALARAGLDVDVDRWLADERVRAAVGVDKKREGAGISFVTLAGVGAPQRTRVGVDELAGILRGEGGDGGG